MPDRASSLRWTGEGTEIFLRALAGMPDDELSSQTRLPGWTGRHLVAHVAANAEALLNLAHWAATGEETPMYPSPDRRLADIEEGAQRSPAELRQWAAESGGRLARTLASLSEEQWLRRVRTAQGRDVPATEIPWLRSREVMVHAVDLDPALRFGELPESFLLALVVDIVQRRSTGEQPALHLTADDVGHAWSIPGAGAPTRLRGSLGGVAAYLAGRSTAGMTAVGGEVPALPPWL